MTICETMYFADNPVSRITVDSAFCASLLILTTLPTVPFDLWAFRIILTCLLLLKFQRAKSLDTQARRVDLRPVRKQAAEISVSSLLVLAEPAVDTGYILFREIYVDGRPACCVMQYSSANLHRLNIVG